MENCSFDVRIFTAIYSPSLLLCLHLIGLICTVCFPFSYMDLDALVFVCISSFPIARKVGYTVGNVHTDFAGKEKFVQGGS